MIKVVAVLILVLMLVSMVFGCAESKEPVCEVEGCWVEWRYNHNQGRWLLEEFCRCYRGEKNDN